jgi:SAM-dependent methyltransferase
LRAAIERRGYCYVNVDVKPFGPGEPSLIGDAHALPFPDESFNLVVSKDTLEHFLDPWTAVTEVYRVLRPGGRFVIWVPFLHPYHGDDFYRYTHLGLRRLLSAFEDVAIDSPRSLFTLAGLVLAQSLKRVGLGVVEQPIKRLCAVLDEALDRCRSAPASYAVAYRVVAAKTGNRLPLAGGAGETTPW